MSQPPRIARSFALTGEGGESRHRFVLKPGVNHVGCMSLCEVVLDSRGVSKRHAIVVLQSDRLSVEDLASKNGTFVNGRRVEQSSIGPGDSLRFGPMVLRLEEVAPAEAELAITIAGTRSAVRLVNLETPRMESLKAEQVPVLAREEPALVAPEGHVRCESSLMVELYKQLRAVARSDLPILVLGETGVGKEGIARILHASSGRGQTPFVAINCAAIPAELLEAELFGIGKGVATGVVERQGKFELAGNGTLFLDEIGDMPQDLQAKLLRALQEKEIHPLGRPSRRIDARVVAATNIDLAERIERGSFRRDLYYRLAGFVLTVPPLRERREDIPVLVEHFLCTYAEEAEKLIRGITLGALDKLVEGAWPGNIRELQNEVRRLVYLCPDHQVIDSARLSNGSPLPSASHADTDTDTDTDIDSEAKTDSDTDTDTETVTVEDPPCGNLDFGSIDRLNLAELERQAVDEALRRSGGNRTRAARMLGISREALRRRIVRFDTSEIE